MVPNKMQETSRIFSQSLGNGTNVVTHLKLWTAGDLERDGGLCHGVASSGHSDGFFGIPTFSTCSSYSNRGMGNTKAFTCFGGCTGVQVYTVLVVPVGQL